MVEGQTVLWGPLGRGRYNWSHASRSWAYHSKILIFNLSFCNSERTNRPFAGPCGYMCELKLRVKLTVKILQCIEMIGRLGGGTAMEGFICKDIDFSLGFQRTGACHCICWIQAFCNAVKHEVITKLCGCFLLSLIWWPLLKMQSFADL